MTRSYTPILVSLATSHWPLATSSNPQSLIPNPFVIRTPTATVTDLGTEFGVEVEKGGGSRSMSSRVVDVVTRECGGHVCLERRRQPVCSRIESGSRQIVVLSAAPEALCSDVATVIALHRQPAGLAAGGAIAQRRRVRLHRRVVSSGWHCDAICVLRPLSIRTTAFGYALDLAQDNAGGFVLTGIGESITTTQMGVQRVPFLLVAGMPRSRLASTPSGISTV